MRKKSERFTVDIRGVLKEKVDELSVKEFERKKRESRKGDSILFLTILYKKEMSVEV